MRADWTPGDPKKLRVGMKVVTEYHHGQETVVRKLTKIHHDDYCSSGYRASADDGGPCPHCKRPFGTAISGVCASWFKPAEEEVVR